MPYARNARNDNTDLSNPKVQAFGAMTKNQQLLHLQHRHGASGLVSDPDAYHATCHGAVCEHEHGEPAMSAEQIERQKRMAWAADIRNPAFEGNLAHFDERDYWPEGDGMV